METVENVNKTKQYTDSAEENQNDRIENPKKFDRYFQFRAQVSDLQSHQIMAINRGESLGVSQDDAYNAIETISMPEG